MKYKAPTSIESKKKKVPVRTFDPRLIHKGKSCTAEELADVYGTGKRVIRRWKRRRWIDSY